MKNEQIFQQMVLEQLSTTDKKVNLNLDLTPHTKTENGLWLWMYNTELQNL